MLAAILVSAPLWAQPVSFGLRVGVPITPMLTADPPRQASTLRFTFGPLIEARLWRGLGLGADLLFERASLAVSPAGSPRADIWQWQAPVTLIYRWRVRTEPFVRAGVSFNRVFEISGATKCTGGSFGDQFYCLAGTPLAELRHPGTYGFVAGGGLRFRLKKLKLEPEVRFTRWADRNFGVQDSAVRSNLSQISFLVGVIF